MSFQGFHRFISKEKDFEKGNGNNVSDCSQSLTYHFALHLQSFLSVSGLWILGILHHIE